MTEKRQASGGTPSSSRKDRSQDEFAEDFFKRLQSDESLPAAGQDVLKAALKALQTPSMEEDTNSGLQDIEAEARHTGIPGACDICGHQNRPGNQFCGMCGLPLPDSPGAAAAVRPVPTHPSQDNPAARQATATPAPTAAPGVHFYHHHYHHHYLPAGADTGAGSVSTPRPTLPEATRDPSRVRTPGTGQPMSRAETSVRKLMQDWALACNTKHLDDLVSLYAGDAMVLRPNHPPVRGTAAIREFFVATLDAGFGEAELDPMRLEVFGDIAYEAGRCKALVPVAVSKRREERGKYLTLLAREGNGEWKIISDCWSSDLSLSSEPETARSSTPAGAAIKSSLPRKNL